MIINIFYLNYFKFANKNLQNQQKLFELEVFDYFIMVSQQSIIVQNMHDIFKKTIRLYSYILDHRSMFTYSYILFVLYL